VTLTRPRHAIILAAGRGSRLGPLTEETPKCLLPVDGACLLDRQVEALAAAGVTDITVVAGFRAERIEAHAAGRWRVIRNTAWATTNSICSLHLAAPCVRGHPFIFQNADVLYAPGLMERFVEIPRANACLIDPLAPFMADEYHVELNAGRIVRYSKDVSPERSAGRSAQLVRIGAADGPAFLDRIAELAAGEGASGFPNQAYDVLMAGTGLWPVFTAGMPWWEVDTAEDYARCQAAFEGPDTTAARMTPGTWARIRDLMRERRLPWRLAWLPTVMRSALSNPVQAAAHVRAFRGGALSRDGLDLAVNGLPFLRLLLDEARQTDITVMLLWGTLLGCVRDGQLIRGDHDLDLGVMARDAGKLPALRERMLRHGFQVRIENSEKVSFVHPRHPRLFLDLDVVRPHPRGWVIINADADPRRRFHYLFPGPVFDRVAPARLAGQLDVTIPGDAEGFLTAVYGNWRVPRSKVHFLYGPNNVEVELLDAPEQ
jgi:choline kinase